MSPVHKKDWGPGYRIFRCENEQCALEWREASRDCTSPSGSVCPICSEATPPYDCEAHYEWKTDKNGNLIERYCYKCREDTPSDAEDDCASCGLSRVHELPLTKE